MFLFFKQKFGKFIDGHFMYFTSDSPSIVRTLSLVVSPLRPIVNRPFCSLPVSIFTYPILFDVCQITRKRGPLKQFLKMLGGFQSDVSNKDIESIAQCVYFPDPAGILSTNALYLLIF